MNYDVVIIGGGPAGLSAGLYAGRAQLKTAIIEKETIGGQIVTTNEIENYPGSEAGSTGPSLVTRMREQAEEFGVEFIDDTIEDVNFDGKIKELEGKVNNYKAKAVIIATGAVPKSLGVPGEKEFAGKGVSYCATCDGPFFQGLDIYVIGGGNTAVEEALQLSNFARKVTIIHRRDELRATKVIQDRAFKNDKIDFIWNSQVVEIKGDSMVESFIIENRETKERKEIKPREGDFAFGLFVLIGFDPATELFKDIIEMKDNYILTDENMSTNISGVFAAGDNRLKPLRQVVTATSDGSIAAVSAEKYIMENFE